MTQPGGSAVPRRAHSVTHMHTHSDAAGAQEGRPSLEEVNILYAKESARLAALRAHLRLTDAYEEQELTLEHERRRNEVTHDFQNLYATLQQEEDLTRPRLVKAQQDLRHFCARYSDSNQVLTLTTIEQRRQYHVLMDAVRKADATLNHLVPVVKRVGALCALRANAQLQHRHAADRQTQDAVTNLQALLAQEATRARELELDGAGAGAGAGALAGGGGVGGGGGGGKGPNAEAAAKSEGAPGARGFPVSNPLSSPLSSPLAGSKPLASPSGGALQREHAQSMRELEKAIHRSSHTQKKALETDDATLTFKSWLAHELSPASDTAMSRHISGEGENAGNAVLRRPRVIVHAQMPARAHRAVLALT